MYFKISDKPINVAELQLYTLMFTRELFRKFDVVIRYAQFDLLID